MSRGLTIAAFALLGCASEPTSFTTTLGHTGGGAGAEQAAGGSGVIAAAGSVNDTGGSMNAAGGSESASGGNVGPDSGPPSSGGSGIGGAAVGTGGLVEPGSGGTSPVGGAPGVGGYAPYAATMCSTDPAAPTELLPASEPLGAIAVDEDFVYYTHTLGSARVMRLPKTSGGQPVPSAAGGYRIEMLHVDATDLVWVEQEDEAGSAYHIRMEPIAGGGEETVATVEDVRIQAITTDADHIYWVDYTDTSTAQNSVDARRRSKDGGEAELVAHIGTALSVADMHVAIDTLYWAQSGQAGGVYAVASVGGIPSQILSAPGAQLYDHDSGRHCVFQYRANDSEILTHPPQVSLWTGTAGDVRDIELRDERVYFARWQQPVFEPGVFSISARDAGPVITLSTQRNVVALAVDAYNVYWIRWDDVANDGGIYCVRRP